MVDQYCPETKKKELVSQIKTEGEKTFLWRGPQDIISFFFFYFVCGGFVVVLFKKFYWSRVD